jgi:NAD(P)-dependent dehydrogenase (short-subunit alcohol dehydrogenase family)
MILFFYFLFLLAHFTLQAVTMRSPSHSLPLLLPSFSSRSFLFTRAVLQSMYEKKVGGNIVIIGSVHSKKASKLKPAYVAAKHGLVGFSRAVAKEAGPHGVRYVCSHVELCHITRGSPLFI